MYLFVYFIDLTHLSDRGLPPVKAQVRDDITCPRIAYNTRVQHSMALKSGTY